MLLLKFKRFGCSSCWLEFKLFGSNLSFLVGIYAFWLDFKLPGWNLSVFVGISSC